MKDKWIYHDSVPNRNNIKNDPPLSLLLSTRHDPSGSHAPWQDHEWHEPHHQQQMCWPWWVPQDGRSSDCYSLHIGHECLPVQLLDEPLPSFQCTKQDQHSIITTTHYISGCWEVHGLKACLSDIKTWQLIKQCLGLINSNKNSSITISLLRPYSQLPITDFYYTMTIKL